MSNTGPEQPRQPKGSPDARGGQYATYQHGVPGVSLEDASSPNDQPGHIDIEYPVVPPEGTFFYPPRCETAEEVAAFWDYVEVPDVVLHRLSRVWSESYDEVTKVWRDRGDYWGYVAEIDFDAAHPEPDEADSHQHAAWEQAREAARTEALASLGDWFDQRPRTVSRFEVRDIARALGRRSSMSTMYADEASRAMDDMVLYEGEMMEIREMYRRTGIPCCADYLLLPENYDLDASTTVEKIAGIEQVAERVAQQVAEQVSAQVGAQVAGTVQAAVSGAEARLAQRVEAEGAQTREYTRTAADYLHGEVLRTGDDIVTKVHKDTNYSIGQLRRR
jgi:hypothetical protein